MEKISVVCPFHDEESAVAPFFDAVLPVLNDACEDWEIVCVDDGSRDRTLELLLARRRLDSRIVVIELSRNFGKEAALTCGIDHATGDAVIPIDADLQDPPDIIRPLIEKWKEGWDVVLAQRADRSADSFAKRLPANLFYKVHNAISEPRIPENVGDFRLMDRSVVEALRQMPEQRRFMKGLFAWVGFRAASVTYVRDPRIAGSTKFDGWRLWNFALEGITSFSTVPLRIWTYIGLAIAALAFLYGAFVVARTLVHGVDVPGYASLLVVVLFLGGVQLIGLGVLGEYIGRVYQESKRRPVYVVRRLYSGRK